MLLTDIVGRPIIHVFRDEIIIILDRLTPENGIDPPPPSPANSAANYQHILPDIRQELRPELYNARSLKFLGFEYLYITSYGIPARPSEVRATFWGDQDCGLLSRDNVYFGTGVLNT